MAAEVEAKFTAADASVLAALASTSRLADADLGPAQTVDELDIYLDTDDGRLAAAGWACRLRDRGNGPLVSLKGPAEAVSTTGIHRRPEHEGPATDARDPADWPPSPARDRLLALSGGAPLAERVRLQQRRTERDVRLHGRHVGTLSLDHVRAGHGDRSFDGELHVVELELAVDDDASVADLERLAGALAAWPGLVADPQTKLAHALTLRAAGSFER